MKNKNNKNIFICIGAVHKDYILKIKTNYYKNRTNPILKKEYLGGVAYNISSKLSLLKENIKLYSLNCTNEVKKSLKKSNIIFKPINKKISIRNYTFVNNKFNKMIMGLANMESYEKLIKNLNLDNFKNKNIIIDLNFNQKNINSIIKYYYKNNLICVCGTSAHKVYKIENIIDKIDILILNKQECMNLTKKNNINDGIKKVIKKNKNILLIITNGKKNVIAYNNNKIIKCNIPKINIKNENGAGDTMSAFFFYFYLKKNNFIESLKLSIAAGSLHVSGYNFDKKNYFKKIIYLSKKINILEKNYNG